MQHKVNGEMKTEIQYYHRIVVVVLVSTSFPIPLGVRFQKNGEGEVACALALLQDLVGHLGRRFLDVLVGDALYLQAPFVQQVERLGLVWAFTLKENQPDLLREAERCTQQAATGVQTAMALFAQQTPLMGGYRDRQCEWWDVSDLYSWPQVQTPVRVIRSRETYSGTTATRSPTGTPQQRVDLGDDRACDPASYRARR
jgi:hypothetical protein